MGWAEMDVRKRIQSLINEVEVYSSQSLYEEAKAKCRELALLIRKSDQIKNKARFLGAVSKKMRELETGARAFEQIAANAQMSTKEQDLVRDLFFHSKYKDSDQASLEGATALLVFGQFGRALREYDKLLKTDSLRVDAAKNILRCHIGLSSLDRAVAEYDHWFSSKWFPPDQLENVRLFFQGILKEKGIDRILPRPEFDASQEPEIPEEDLSIDIVAIEIPIYSSSGQAKGIPLDVSFQNDDMLSVIIPKKYKVLVDKIQIGAKLKDILFLSPAAFFKGACSISAKREIQSGPKQGDYTLVLKMLGE
jgi:hypothetical protein